MKRTLLVIMLACAFLAFQQATAESAQITGKIMDVNGKGIAGAKVTVEGQDVGTTSSKTGSFKLAKVAPGQVFLYCSAANDMYLDGETKKALSIYKDSKLTGIEIVLSGRPGKDAEFVGIDTCKTCHADEWPEHFKAFDGTPSASVHSRFVDEGTGRMVYPDMWPKPGDKYLPRDPKGKLLMVQDPLDGHGLVNLALCTQDGKDGRDYLFKFYPERSGAKLTEKDLDCSSQPKKAVWIPVGGTIGGQGNWGEGYADPDHQKPDRYPNFGEGKQRYLARIQDVPYLKKWMADHNIPVQRAKQDYVAYMPVYLVQDGTPAGSSDLAKGDVGVPKFWQKGPAHWCFPENTLSRGCAGCHATGVEIQTTDVMDDPKHPNKSIVTAFDYTDLNITCERCHGPGSEHVSSEDKIKIISPAYLTAKAGNELCGQCHGSHSGKSERPKGIHKYPFDQNSQDSIGSGYFVPGVSDLNDFYYRLDEPSVNNKWKEGTYNSWPDQVHSRAHSQMLSETNRSAHNNNTTEKLTCFTCHDAHTQDGATSNLVVGEYNFENATYGNNTLCLACHADNGPFEKVQKADVAVLQLDAGRKVTKNGVEMKLDPVNAVQARSRVANAVGKHMQVKAGMGMVLYTPDDPDMPLGSCTSCHMAKIGKLFDLNDDAQYHLARDSKGQIAVAEGNVGNHIFDIVWPGQSSVLKNPDMSKAHDYDIMPNSCSKCHASARMSGDGD